jgi:hypothetical protein
VSGLLLLAAGCAEPPATAQVPAVAPPVPPGQARLWFYRPWEPSESLNLADIVVNGSYFASIENGGAFYRDVPPGQYHIAPVSFVHDPSQDANIALVPGQQVYVKIVSLQAWGSENTASRTIKRDAFWAWLIPPQQAQAEIAFNRGGI